MEEFFSTEDYIKALTVENLQPYQKKMLEINYYACEHTITATDMATQMGYPNFNSANLQYGKLAKLIGRHLGIEKFPEFAVNIFVSFEKPFNEWLWIMKPQLVKALEDLKWVNDGKKNFIPEEIEDNGSINEGAVKTIKVNAYERNAKARAICIAHYGTICNICGIDLTKIYGSVAKEFIHVHHKKRLCDIGKEYEVDPLKDLIPLCPNCHAIVHLRSEPYTIEEVKEFIKRKG